MNALTPKAAFDVLIVSELSRLGREQLETGYALKQLSQAGVKVWSFLEDREILLNTPTDKFLMSAMSFAAEVEREKARQRVSDAMLRKARLGYVCGGRTFGYKNERVDGHVERRINKDEAAVVRRIFALCVDGNGLKTITKILNAEGVISPRPKRGRPRAWAPSSVRTVLYQDLYRGVAVYNRRRMSDMWGRRKRRWRPAREWITVDVPQLRIVSDEQWAAAHTRLEAARQAYLKDTGGRRFGHPP